MRHLIDPTIDCVFKAILGADERRHLLIHFLNATLGERLPYPITEVNMQNPYNPREFPSDKETVVDVRARDVLGRTFQVEIQVGDHEGLACRMLYTWFEIFRSQIGIGEDYSLMQPVYSIWILAENLHDIGTHLTFEVYDVGHRLYLTDRFEIHILQLKMLEADATIKDELTRWMMFFKLGKTLTPDNLPDWMDTPEMREAMAILNAFSDREHDYHNYQRQVAARCLKITHENRMKRALAAEQQALAAEQRALAVAEKARTAEEEARTAEEEARAAEEEARAAEEEARAAEEEARTAEEEARAAEEEARAAEEEARAAEEEARAAEEEALTALEQERTVSEQERLEKERLLALLKEHGIEP